MGDLVDPKPIYDEDVGGVYHPKDALSTTVHAVTYTGAAGLFLAAVQNTVAKESIGPLGIFTRFGKTIGIFGTCRRCSRNTVLKNRILTMYSCDGRHLRVC